MHDSGCTIPEIEPIKNANCIYLESYIVRPGSGEGSDPLDHRRMRIIEFCVQWMGVQIGKVLARKFH